MEELGMIHDSQSMKFRSPFGAVEVGVKVNLSIEINRDVIVAVYIVKGDRTSKNIGMNKEYLDDGLYRYSTFIDTTDYTGLIEYFFIVGDGQEKVYYGNNDERLGGVGKVYNHDPVPYQITVYEKNIVPNWYKEGIIYQIFVDRFFNGNEDGKVNYPKKNSFIYGTWDDSPMYIKDNLGRIVRWDFYGGNLKGIIHKLDYLKELGISIIYLNPIFQAASCHKYDTGDYEIVDEMFGTNEEFKILCEKAKERGIKIILDGVFSHTGADSKYFNRFCNYETNGACQSTDSPYYRWYRFTDYPQSYECWWGIDTQPNVDEMEPSYIDYIINGKNSIIQKWMELGASGWRLDVADELPDEFISMIKEKMNEVCSDNILIGEVWEDASNKISYSKRREYLYGKELDSVTNYPLRDSLINFVKGYIKSDKFSKKVMSLFENYPTENFYGNMNIIGTHDTERILTILDKKIELLKIIVLLQMTLPGVPLVYYGDEAGLEGGKDPENRKAYPWGKENKKILDFYRKVIKIRNKENSLKKGDLKFYSTDLDVCAFQRCYENEKIIVVANTNGSRITLENINIEGSYIDLLDEENGYKRLGDNNVLALEGYDIKVLKCDE